MLKECAEQQRQGNLPAYYQRQVLNCNIRWEELVERKNRFNGNIRSRERTVDRASRYQNEEG